MTSSTHRNNYCTNNNNGCVQNISGSYAVNKNELIMSEGEKATALRLLLQGKLDFYISPPMDKIPSSYSELKHNSYRVFELEQNLFLGADEILKESTYSFTVAAASECTLYAYEAKNETAVSLIIDEQKDYGAYIINSMCILMDNLIEVLKKLSDYRNELESINRNLNAFYALIVDEYGLKATEANIYESGSLQLSRIQDKNTMILPYFSKQFIESDLPEPALSGIEPDTLSYFSHLYSLPADLKKTFFASDQFITMTHIKKASELIEQLLSRLKSEFCLLEQAITLMYSDNEVCYYKAFQKAANEMYAEKFDIKPALDASNYIFDKVIEISKYIETEYMHIINIDKEFFAYSHENYKAYFDPENTDEVIILNEAGLNIAPALPEELTGSAIKILEYSELPEEKVTFFMMNLIAFRNMKDKLSTDEASRQIRSSISESFFEVYNAVFKKAYRLKDKSRLIKMFLSYGYMDENLLNINQILEIYKIAGKNKESAGINVYYMDEWLSKIYSIEKDPSVNNFGHDYFDIFRELKKQGKAVEKDRALYANDKDGRLDFEISNMLKTNHKICQGQISLYFPILYSDMAPASPLRSLVTPSLIKEKLDRILMVDYSAFHREINYMDAEKGIEKELVMMSVTPDFILIPVYGSHAIMWQEITGRVRSTPGRILIPVFTDENIDDILVRLVGNFRWELCRTMMGSAWNDITQRSLTSEYTDYVQFYRKNRDLTEEAKNKLKSLISKHHNRLREIFTSDYEMWINYESKGNPRLNKVARAILLRYCPFSKEIRDFLEKQPMYIDLINQMKLQKAKQVKDLKNRYKRYLKVGNGSLDKALDDNLAFYRDN